MKQKTVAIIPIHTYQTLGLWVVATNDVVDGVGQATQAPLTGIAWNIVIEPVLGDEAEQ